MKAIRVLSLAFVALATANAEETSSIDEIVRKRDSLLNQIVEYFKKGAEIGTSTEEEVRSATLNLYSFRRDSAKTHSERLQWQERIIASEKERIASIKLQMAQGTASPIDAVRAEERVLAAEQKLLELQLVK